MYILQAETLRSILLILFVLSIPVQDAIAQGVSENMLVSIECQQKTIPEILSLIEPQIKMPFFYSVERMTTKKLDFKVKELNLSEALKELFSGTSLDYIIYRESGIIIGDVTIVRNAYSADYYKTLTVPIEDLTLQSSNKPIIIGNKEKLASNGRVILSGSVLQQKDKSPVIGATIRIPGSSYGTATDENGKFRMEIPAGSHNLLTQYIGNADLSSSILAYSDGEVKLVMEAETINLKEVTIGTQAIDANIKAAQIGVTQLNLKTLRKLPVFMGETDIVKTLLTTPGVSSLGEGATGFNVRGGEVDQNLILQDEGLIFNSSHALGFFSAFNADLIQSVNLYKSILPASFGGRLASALDIEMREGDYTKFKIKSGIGLVSGRITIEGPIQKDKTSVILGIRSSYSDWLLKQAKNIEVKNSTASFYDANIRLSHKFNNKNSLSVSVYNSYDRFEYNKSFGFQYGTLNIQSIYKKIFSSKVYSKWIISKGNYNSQQTDLTGTDASRLKNQVDQWQFKNNITINQRTNLQYQFGFQTILYKILPGDRSPFASYSNVIPKRIENEKGLESAAYFSMDKSFSGLQVNAGLRISHYAFLGPKSIFQYSTGYPYSTKNISDTILLPSNSFIKSNINLEPRFSLRYSINSTSSIKSGYARTVQYVNQIFNSDSPTPTSQYQLSTEYILPTKAHNISIGYFKNFKDNLWESSIEIFGRHMSNVLDYKDFADLYVNDHIETELLRGTGRAYGAELSIKKIKGELNGSFAYTLSRTERQINGISNSRWYPSNFDKPHQITMVLNHQYNQRHSFSVNFVYNTGRPTTAPQGSYRSLSGVPIPIYSSRNWLRIPDYHRMDLAYTFGHGYKKRKKIKTSWTVSIYNLYARKNAFSVYFTQTPFTGAQANKLAVLGTVFPSITLNLETR